MSRAHPLGLRIASKTFNTPFIGISQYYFYNQLKQNIVINKNTQLLSKLLVMPVNPLNGRFGKNNAKVSEIAYSRALPTNVLLKAKQLFDSQYALNKKRLFNAAVFHAEQLQQRFEKSYNSFTKNRCLAFYFKGKTNGGVTKRQKKQRLFSTFLFVPTNKLLQKLKKTKKSRWYKRKQRQQQKKDTPGKPTLRYLNPYHTLLYSPPLFLENISNKRLTRLSGSASISNNAVHLLQNIDYLKKAIKHLTAPIIRFNLRSCKNNKKKKIKPIYYFYFPCSFPTLGKKPMPMNYSGSFNQQQFYNGVKREISNIALLAFLTQLSPINRALYQYLALNSPQSLPFLLSLNPIVASSLAKNISNRQKPLHINSISVDKAKISTNAYNYAISYVVYARPESTTLKLKNISKKFTRQIENFRNSVKVLMPLKVLIHRNFLEPIGIHYISVLDYRLVKTYCNKPLKNRLFVRTPKDYLRSNYMRSQQGLVRLKDAILFEFAYTKNSLIKLDLKKTNTLMQQLLETGHAKLWLRKMSSIRL